MHCLSCMHNAQGCVAPRVSAYILGNARVPMLQLICYTSSTLKLPLSASAALIHIETLDGFDCGNKF